MRKLTPAQVNTIAYLKREGIRTIVIARTLQMMAGVALSATYHHVTKLELDDKTEKKRVIVKLMQEGYNTKQIADMNNWSLVEVNRIYLR